MGLFKSIKLVDEYIKESSERRDDAFDDECYDAGDERYKEITLELLLGILTALERIAFLLAVLFGFLIASGLF